MKTKPASVTDLIIVNFIIQQMVGTLSLTQVFCSPTDMKLLGDPASRRLTGATKLFRLIGRFKVRGPKTELLRPIFSVKFDIIYLIGHNLVLSFRRTKLLKFRAAEVYTL